MDTLQCAVVLAKLECFADEVTARVRIGARYHAELADIDGLRRTTLHADRSSVHAQYTVAVADRDAFIAALKAAEVPTAVHYPVPLHRQPAYAGLCRHGDLRHAETASAQVVSLPMHPYMDEAAQDRVVIAARAALRQGVDA